jgi:hypothetical protein
MLLMANLELKAPCLNPQSKLANILFSLELQRQFNESGSGAQAYSLHPGFVQSELFKNLPRAFEVLVRVPLRSLPQLCAR